jgi:hypothetical protein
VRERERERERERNDTTGSGKGQATGFYEGGIEPTNDLKCSEYLDYLNNSLSWSYFALNKRVTFSSGLIIYFPNIVFVIKYVSLALVLIYFCQTSTVAKLITNADITLRSQRLFFLLRISSLVYKTIFLFRIPVTFV